MNLKRVFRLAPVLALMALIVAACECGVSSIAPFPEHWYYTPTVYLFDLPSTRTPTPVVQALVIEPSPVQEGCPMEWVAPTASAVMPDAGRVGFDWSPHPGANAYAVKVTQPNGSEIVYEAGTDAYDLFMENYSQGGEYTVEIQAFDASGNPLCAITTKFQKNTPAKTKPDVKCSEVCKADPSCPPTVACAPICTTVCK